MSLYSTYFAIGYVPVLAAKYFHMLAFSSQYLEHADDALRTVANGEFDRLQDSGQAELAEQQLWRTMSLADTLRLNVPQPPDDPNDFSAWFKAVQDAVRQSLESVADRQELTAAYAAGQNAATVIQAANQLAHVIRYLIAAYTPQLESQWDGLTMQMQQTIPRLLHAAAHPGLPDCIRDLGVPYSNVVGDLMLFPKRCDDKPYLVLLGRNLQNEVYNLLDLLEETDETLANQP